MAMRETYRGPIRRKPIDWPLMLAAFVCAVLAFTLVVIGGQIAGDIPPQNGAGYPPCQTEDSTGCHWDADTRGNGQGRSFVVDDTGVVTYDDGEVAYPACTDQIAEAGGMCEGPLVSDQPAPVESLPVPVTR